MEKFTLYFIDNYNVARAIYTSDELHDCLDCIKQNNLFLNRCLIQSPNKRKITFDQKGSMYFGAMPTENK